MADVFTMGELLVECMRAECLAEYVNRHVAVELKARGNECRYHSRNQQDRRQFIGRCQRIDDRT